MDEDAGLPQGHRRRLTNAPGLKPGSYPVAVYHDGNGNDVFDRGLFGYPLEKFGFSNDAIGFFSPPPFTAARLTLGAKDREITITLTR